MVVAVAVLGSADLWDAPGAARAAAGATSGPALAIHLSTSPGVVLLATVATGIGAAIGLVGWWPRVGFAVAAGGGVVALGAGQLVGSAVHTHHLVWLCAILALSPCGDAWAPGTPTAPPSWRHGAATLAVYATLGAVYAGPGLHKLFGDWDGAALTHHLWWKWAQVGAVPDFRPDLHPGWMAVAAAAVVVVELWAPVGLLVGRTRAPTAVALGLFHLGAGYVAGIPFSSLWICLFAALPVGRAPKTDVRRPDMRAVLPFAVVLPVVLAAAAGDTRAWPFACYPTFDEDPGEIMPSAVVVAVDGDVERELPLAPFVTGRAQRGYGRLWRVTGVTSAAGPAERASAAREWLCAAAAPAGRVRVYAATRSVRPAHLEGAAVRGPLRADVTCESR